MAQIYNQLGFNKRPDPFLAPYDGNKRAKLD